MNELPVYFFTIVFNGSPYIFWHYLQFARLDFPWKWIVVEGPARHDHCGGWALQNGGQPLYTPDGVSTDGTNAYLKIISAFDLRVKHVTIGNRVPKVWRGKIEMVNMVNTVVDLDENKECLLFQVDVDEIWTAEQLVRARDLFLEDPDATAAKYRCYYFVGPDKIVTTKDTYGNHDWEWVRTWRYQRGDKWERHEPPVLKRNGKDLACMKLLGHDKTEPQGLVFRHFAYATRQQIEFKQRYYGYKNAVADWLKLQANNEFPCPLSRYFQWIHDGAMVDMAGRHGILPLIDV